MSYDQIYSSRRCLLTITAQKCFRNQKFKLKNRFTRDHNSLNFGVKEILVLKVSLEAEEIDT